MAKGKGERGKGGGGAAADEEQEQKLQAILLADSFNTNFRPISFDMPKVLISIIVILRCTIHSILRYWTTNNTHNQHSIPLCAYLLLLSKASGCPSEPESLPMDSSSRTSSKSG